MRFLKYAIIGLILSLSITAHAATSWDVANEPQFFLDSTITSSQTTGIRLSAPFLNGEEVNMITTTGGVLRFRQGVKREDVYYSSASVNSSTKVVTLSGVIRDLCRGVTRAIQGCGHGQQFNKGAIVELSVDARLLNLKANVDRLNQFTASGGVSGILNGSGFLVFPKYTNTTTRLSQFGSNPVTGSVSCVIADGVCYYYFGSQWISFGSGAQVNATATIAGKSQAATLAQLQILSSTGSTGALNFITPGLFIKNGSGSVSANRPVLTGNNGALSVTVGGMGRVTHTTGAIIIGQGAGGVTGIVGTSANQVPIWDGSRWAANNISLLSDGVVVHSNFTGSSLIGISSTAQQDFDTTRYAIPANSLLTGSSIEISVRGLTRIKSGQSQTVAFFIGSTQVSSEGICGGSSTLCTFNLEGSITFPEVGHTGKMMWHIRESGMDDGITNTISASTGAVLVNTTNALILKATGTMDTSSPTINSRTIQTIYKRRN